MGIRFACPNGHKLNVKEHLAGKRGICPNCGAKFVIPAAGDADGPVEVPPATAAATSGFPEQRDVPPNTDANSPSVVISVVESSILAKDPPTTIGAPPPLPPTAPPALDFVATPAAPAPAPASVYVIRRARSRRMQMQIAVLLFLAAIVLAVVLVWVLRHGPTAAAPTTDSTTRIAPRTRQAYLAKTVIFA